MYAVVSVAHQRRVEREPTRSVRGAPPLPQRHVSDESHSSPQSSSTRRPLGPKVVGVVWWDGSPLSPEARAAVGAPAPLRPHHPSPWRPHHRSAFL